MSDTTTTLPAVVEAQTAIATARQVLAQHQDALVFVREEDLQTHPMFVPQVMFMVEPRESFHLIQSKLMPKRHITDKIGEYCGVTFIAASCHCRVEGANEQRYVGVAQGKKRLPDGTWKESALQEYEYDVDVRSKEDFFKHPDTYKTEVKREEHWNDLKKFARSKANTGARLRVIRELALVPISFDPKEISRGMVFGRTEVNNAYIQQDPELRRSVTMAALGMSDDIFERKVRDVTPQPQLLSGSTKTPPARGERGEQEELEPDPPWDEPNEDVIRRGLRNQLDEAGLPEDATSAIETILKRDDATEKELQELLDRVEGWRKRKAEKAAAAAS